MTKLIKTLDGSFLPPGKVKRSMVANFFDLSIPAWLEADSGTPSFTTGAKRLTVTTAASAGAQASVRLSSDLHIDSFDAVFWTIEGFSASSDTDLVIGIELQGASSGASIFHRTSGATAVSRINNDAGTEEDVNYRLRGGGEAGSRRNITIALFPQSEHLYLLEGDQVMYHRKFSGLSLSPVRPKIVISTDVATAHSMSFYQAKLDLYQN